MSAITVETLINELGKVQDKQAKVVISRDGGTYDIDKIVTPGKDEDYVILAVDGRSFVHEDDADGDDEG